MTEIIIPVNYAYNYVGNCISKVNIGILNCEQDIDICRKCESDLDFYIPFIQDEIIYYQFHFRPLNLISLTLDPEGILNTYLFNVAYGWNDAHYGLIDWDIDMWLECNGQLTHFTDLFNSDEYGVGVDKQGIAHGYFKFDSSKINCNCFRFKIIYKSVSGNIEHWTDKYYKENCDVDMVYIKGVYDYKDVKGNFYAQFGDDSWVNNNNLFINQMRIYGTFEKTQWEERQEIINVNQVVATTDNSVYLFRTYPIPEHIADRLAMILTSKELYINGNRYYISGNIQKNNDEGLFWLLSVEIKQLNDNITFDCAN